MVRKYHLAKQVISAFEMINFINQAGATAISCGKAGLSTYIVPDKLRSEQKDQHFTDDIFACILIKNWCFVSNFTEVPLVINGPPLLVCMLFWAIPLDQLAVHPCALLSSCSGLSLSSIYGFTSQRAINTERVCKWRRHHGAVSL